MYLAVSIFPTNTAENYISSFTTTLTENFLVILAILAFVFGLKLVFNLFSSAVNKGTLDPAPGGWGGSEREWNHLDESTQQRYVDEEMDDHFEQKTRSRKYNS